MPPPLVELLSAAIVASFVVVRARVARHRWRFVGELVLLAAAAALAEASCIAAYGFYSYAPEWTVWIGPVPLLVVLIWPCVILSAWDIARHLAPARAPLVAGLLVLADASLIEPIAVAAGLWSWSAPGLFGVPPVGVVGWALFTGAAVFALERGARWWLVPLTLGAVHLGLLATWWGALRWLSTTLPPWPAVTLLAVAAALLTVWSARAGAAARVPRWVMTVRVAPASLFLLLLVAAVRDSALWAWALAFVPPYLSLLVGGTRLTRGPSATPPSPAPVSGA